MTWDFKGWLANQKAGKYEQADSAAAPYEVRNFNSRSLTTKSKAGNAKVDFIPDVWDGYHYRQIDKYIRGHFNAAGQTSASKDDWMNLAKHLGDRAVDIPATFNATSEGAWRGAAADAAKKAMSDYSKSLEGLVHQVKSMGGTMEFWHSAFESINNDVPLADWIDREIAANWDDYRFPNGISTSDPDYESLRQSFYDEQGRYASQVCQNIMKNQWNPNLETVAGNFPLFTAPTNQTSPNRDVPGGKGGPNGTGGGGGGGGGGKTPTGALGKPNMNKPNTKPANLNTPNNSGLDGLKNAMSGLSGMGQNLAGQAGNLANMGKNLAGKQVPKPSPHLLNNKKNFAKTSTGGKGGGKGGGGGGKGGGAGGAKPTGAALREGLSKALKTASLGDRALGSMSRATTSSPMMGGPMGGAGARGGGGGEDKVHKANKFLQTTANGEALLGVPLATVSSVLKAVPGDVPLADVGTEASASKA